MIMDSSECIMNYKRTAIGKEIEINLELQHLFQKNGRVQDLMQFMQIFIDSTIRPVHIRIREQIATPLFTNTLIIAKAILTQIQSKDTDEGNLRMREALLTHQLQPTIIKL